MSVLAEGTDKKKAYQRILNFTRKQRNWKIIIKLNRINFMTDSMNISAVILNEENEYILSGKWIAK